MRHWPPTRHTIQIIALAAICCLECTSPAISASPDSGMPSGVLILLSPAGELSVVPLKTDAAQIPDGRGLMVVNARQGELIRFVPPVEEGENLESLSFAARLVDGTRQDGVSAGEGLAFATVEIDQLLGQYVVRGTGFATPTGRVLDGRVTIRRSIAPENEDTDGTAVVLRRGNRILLTIPFPPGQSVIRWADIPDLPAALRQGLRPGEYTLQESDGGPVSRFVVEPEEIRQWVFEPLDQLQHLLKHKDAPLYYQVAAEHLIGVLDEFGRPQPYLSDALDLLENAPAESITPHLAHIRRDIRRRLSGNTVLTDGDDDTAPSDSVGIASIDRVRQYLVAGRNSDALAILDSDQAAEDERSQALAVLYRGVVLSESGATYEGPARDCFIEAIARLENGRETDLFRARNNYAGFLFGQARDRLHNHAFQMASGVRNSLMTALLDWHEARRQWQQALQLADGLGTLQRASANANLARLYAALADIIRTLDVPVDGERRFLAGQQAAEAEARRLAEQAAESLVEETDAMIAAVAHETLADLAYRNDDFATTLEHGARARRFYLNAGSLAGVEGVCRLLGQCHLRRPKADRDEALRQLKLAHFLAEILRDRMSTDQIGLSRAGFFARRAYVNQLLVELLLEDQQPVEALRFVELAKARALEDILAASGETGRDTDGNTLDLEETLAAWPSDVASLVYSLGTRRAWVFLVDTSGKVTAHVLRDANDQPLSSRELIVRIRALLNRTEQQAVKMRGRLLGGKGFDHGWQDDLYSLYRELIPAEVVAPLREAESVLIVPDHILHYFPFAALVTKRDEMARDSSEMIDPKFWIEESFSLCHAPSLGTWDLLRQRPDRRVAQANAFGIVDFQFAPRLPGVEQDLSNFNETFGDRVNRVLSGPDAEEGRARDVLRHPGLLLVATHGVNTADQPLYSHLMFQPDSENDGLLTAGELYSLPVGADLIVMSACYSGLADRSPLPGDDLFGLQRALLHSGGRGVVSGLWDVYDGTGPELMKSFFQNLNSGLTAPEALAASQRAFLQQLRKSDEPEPWLHPYFWAVYKYVGDDRVRLSAETQ